MPHPPRTVRHRRERDLRPLNTDFDLYSKGKDDTSHRQSSHRESHSDVVCALDGPFIGRGQDF